jgi:hypothetical protein
MGLHLRLLESYSGVEVEPKVTAMPITSYEVIFSEVKLQLGTKYNCVNKSLVENFP